MALADVEVFEDAVPLVRSCPALNEIRTSGELKELVIEVKHGATLNAHRIILAARIPSLRAALSGALGKDNSVLKWPTVPLNLANSLIQYVYTGQLEVTQTNAMAVVMFAKMMKLSDLENWGVQFMANRSSNMGSLMETCIKLMQAQFMNFVSTNLFVRLPADTLLTLLRNDHLSVDSEEAVFEAISSWVDAGDKECDNQRLKLHAPEMLKEVRWCQTTLQFRSRLVGSHPMFQEGNSCVRFMALVEQWISNADKDKPPCPFNRRRRTPPTIFFVFGKDKDQDRWSVLRFDPQLEKEERIADMEKREWATYSPVGESIFVVGGRTAQGRYSTSVEEFLVAERRWRKRASLAVGRRCHAAAVLTEAGGEALIGVFGGWGNGGPLSSCEVYEVSRDRWFKLPDLREKRNATAAACLSGDSRVFVFGGSNGPSSPLASVEFCQLRADWRERATSSDFWQPAAPMRTARDGLAATHFQGKIIVAGGYDGDILNMVEMFTPPDARCPRGQWTELAGMKEPRVYFALLTSNDDAIFALGPGNAVETFTAPGGNDLPQRLNYLIQSHALAVLGRAPRHAQPAHRELPPAKSLHRPPHRRRQQSSILPLPEPFATASARDAERTGGPQGYGDPRERGPQLMEEFLLRHLLSARQRYCTSPRRRLENPTHREDTNSATIGRTTQRRPQSSLHHLRHRHRPPVPSEDQHQPRPPTLSLHETIRTVQQLSSGKAPASDASSAEVCKHHCPKFMEHLTALFQETWCQKEVPHDFKDSTIIHLYKRIGNRHVCDNHRGICLLNIAGKIFAHILLNRLHNYLDQSVLAKSQCGFRRYRGTMDRIFATHQLQEKHEEMRTDLHSSFVDLTNAFDRVNCDEVWKIMR
ncbi:hypothetical protein SprV_1002913700 [Sparganum proliferum]